MHLPATPTALLFAYAFLSNIALAVVPHEPAIIWYGPRLGVWTTTLVGTAGTMLAAVADHPLFAPLIGRLAQRTRSEEHTSELPSQSKLVCRLLLEKKKQGVGHVAGEMARYLGLSDD